MQMSVNADSNGSANIEVTNQELLTVKQLLADRPLLQLMAELETVLTRAKETIRKTLADMEARHNSALHESQSKLYQLRNDLLLADSDLRSATARGKYSEAPAIEARKVEIHQGILQAELDSALIVERNSIERNNYLRSVSDQGNAGASMNGLPYDAIAQITRAVIWEWLTTNMSESITSMVSEKYQNSRYDVADSQNGVAFAEKALQDFKKAASNRYSGAGVKATANAQPAPPVKGYGFREWGPMAGGSR